MVRHETRGMGQRRLRMSAIALMFALPCAVSPALAQQAASASANASTNAMVNLINLLVKQGTITKANGDALLAQAQGDADKARANVAAASANAGLPPPPEGTIRVPYVPETVRRQIADQVRSEVMAQAKSEGWAAPDKASPDWARRIKISGDVRFRSQSDLYARSNDNTILDIARLGAGSAPINVTDVQNLPFLNTTQDRLNRLRIRARLGITAEISPAVTAGIRIATGDDNSPISTNQNLAGGFAKRDLWLDKAYLELRPKEWIKADFGRFANPFRSTELLFDDDLNFDGVAVSFDIDKFKSEGLYLAVRGGAFPLDTGSSNYPDTSTTKSKYAAKWLFSGQIEGSYATSGGIVISGAAGYHDFHNIQGQRSAPCAFNGVVVPISLNSADPTECSTDGTRAIAPRKGNTLFFLRNITVPATEPVGIKAERQYLGLAYKFRVLDLNTSVTVPLNDDITATLAGNYLRNLAFHKADVCRYGAGVQPFTNNGPILACSPGGSVLSGNQGWMVNMAVGYAKPHKWGQWNASLGYRYLETDAVPDAFPDSDFHLGGTNLKGYSVAATFGLLDGVSLGGRWMSANEVTGAPLSIDVLQFDLKAEF